jgi:hypothetical protein
MQYKVVVTFGTPLAPRPARAHAATAKAAAQVLVGGGVGPYQTTKPVPGMQAGETTTQDWEFWTVLPGLHQVTVKVK